MPRLQRAPNESVPFRQLPAAALRASLANYSGADFRADLLAGVVVGVVALPLSMALAYAVSDGASRHVPPQIGLYTAIVAGIVVSLLGGSRTQVTGPTAAFVAILAPIFTNYGLAGLLTAGLMAGVILVAMSVFRMGRFLQFIPHPVTTGFTAGIAVVIATSQLKDFFGLHIEKMPGDWLERVATIARAFPTVTTSELGIGAFTLAVLIFFPRLSKRVPSPLVAIALATVAALALHAWNPELTFRSISSIHSTVNGRDVAGVPQLPPLPGTPWGFSAPGDPVFHLDFATIKDLLPAAFAIAMLGAIESLLSAVVSDGMAGTRHDPDAELFALGIGNIVTPIFGGIACTGAIARTATNIRSGGRSPIACVVHAFFILGAVLALAPILGYIPLAALAALLLMVAWNMSDAKHFARTLRIAPRSDVAVLLTCFTLTVVFDMVKGVAVGIVLAAILFMNRMAEVTRVKVMDHHPRAGGTVPKGVLVYDIAGPLFFGAAEKAMGSLHHTASLAKIVILELDECSVIDSTGLVALESALDRLQKDGRFAIVSGLQEQPKAAMEKAQIVEIPGTRVFAVDLDAAIDLAKIKLTDPSLKTPAGGVPRVQPADPIAR